MTGPQAFHATSGRRENRVSRRERPDDDPLSVAVPPDQRRPRCPRIRAVQGRSATAVARLEADRAARRRWWLTKRSSRKPFSGNCGTGPKKRQWREFSRRTGPTRPQPTRPWATNRWMLGSPRGRIRPFDAWTPTHATRDCGDRHRGSFADGMTCCRPRAKPAARHENLARAAEMPRETRVSAPSGRGRGDPTRSPQRGYPCGRGQRRLRAGRGRGLFPRAVVEYGRVPRMGPRRRRAASREPAPSARTPHHRPSPHHRPRESPCRPAGRSSPATGK
jgi:hypothetical protein